MTRKIVTNAELSEREMVPDFVRVHGPQCEGALRTGAAAMISFSLSKDPRKGGAPTFFDALVNEQQVDGLLEDLRRLKLEQDGIVNAASAWLVLELHPKSLLVISVSIRPNSNALSRSDAIVLPIDVAHGRDYETARNDLHHRISEDPNMSWALPHLESTSAAGT